MSATQPSITSNLVDNVSPASVYFIATPSDTVDLPQSVKAIYCVTAGNVVLEDWAVTTNQTTLAMTAGQQINIRPRKIRATGTTGSYMVLLG